VLSHGTINGSILATNLVGDPEGGKIGSVVALGDINGSIIAAAQVGSVRSGSQVNGTVSAPITGAVTPLDSTVITEFALPVIPASIMPALLVDKATILNQWLTDAAAIQADVSTAKADIAASIATMRADMTTDAANIDAERMQTESDLAIQRLTDQAALRSRFDDSRAFSVQQNVRTMTAALNGRNSAIKQQNDKIAAGNAAYQKSVQEAIDRTTALYLSIQELHTQLQTNKTEFDQDADEMQDWSGQMWETAKQLSTSIFSISARWESAMADWDKVEQLWNEYENGSERTWVDEAYFKVANMFPGMRQIQGAIDGRDPWTLEKILLVDRILSGAMGVLEVFGTVMGAGRVVNFFTAPCRKGWIFGTCFTGDTPVLIDVVPEGMTVAQTELEPLDESSSLGGWFMLVGIGTAVTARMAGKLERPTRRKRGRRRKPVIDRLFMESAGGGMLDELHGGLTHGGLTSESALSDARTDSSSTALAETSLSDDMLYDELSMNPQNETASPFSADPASRSVLTAVATSPRQPVSQLPLQSSQDSPPKTAHDSPPDQNDEPASSGWVRRGLWAVTLAFLSVGGWLSYDGMSPAERPQLASAVGALEGTRGSLEAAPVEYLSKPISQLRTMHDRVLAHNPLADETEPPLLNVDPGQWRVVTLQHEQPDGSRAIVERGVPLAEVTAEGLSVGRSLHVTLPEFNLSGGFTVTGIAACPTPASGDGHLVTSRFIHENTEVWDLSFERAAAPLGTTASHPFWSEDRQEFVAAADLHHGERLLLADGTTRRLESLAMLANRTTSLSDDWNDYQTFRITREQNRLYSTTT
jgi:hypothetical protein